MQLALRKTAATGATFWARLAAWAIKTRLVSQYCHGGIVIGDRVYHATAAHGLCDAEFAPEKWDLFDLGADRDVQILSLYRLLQGAKYDWVSLLAFVVPWRVSDADRMYCFEWCWMCIEDRNPSFRVTPEMLLESILKNKKG